MKCYDLFNPIICFSRVIHYSTERVVDQQKNSMKNMLSYYDKSIYNQFPWMANFYGYSLGKCLIPSINTNGWYWVLKTNKSHLILLYDLRLKQEGKVELSNQNWLNQN